MILEFTALQAGQLYIVDNNSKYTIKFNDERIIESTDETVKMRCTLSITYHKNIIMNDIDYGTFVITLLIDTVFIFSTADLFTAMFTKQTIPLNKHTLIEVNDYGISQMNSMLKVYPLSIQHQLETYFCKVTTIDESFLRKIFKDAIFGLKITEKKMVKISER